jgi:predicted alpha/beta superfamily hydrolase
MRRVISKVLAFALLAHTAVAAAKPGPDQLMDAPVLREASAYRFTTLELDSADGARHYRIWLGQPERVNKANPVAYLLDGNAAMAALDVELLNRLAVSPEPPVLVAVGYATPLRIERTARTFDYTPKVGDTEDQRDPLTDVASGGADAFLDLLIGKIRPLINQRLGLQPAQQLLWGHSYGGLLVLHTLMTRPETFQAYAAASPSLWWNSDAVFAESHGLAHRLNGRQPQLLLMRGEQEPATPGTLKSPDVEPDAAARRWVSALQNVEGLKTRYKTFPGLSHGPMLPASLRYTLETLSQSSQDR